MSKTLETWASSGSLQRHETSAKEMAELALRVRDAVVQWIETEHPELVPDR